MNPIFLMRVNETNMTKSELMIMRYSIENLELISNFTINEFADKLNISKSAISRFCKKIGYHGYSQFKYDIKRHLAENDNEGHFNKSEYTVATIYSETIKKVDDTVNTEVMSKLKDSILNANKIKVFGFSETGLTADFFAFRLTDHGFDVEAVTHSSFYRKKIILADKDDIMIFFSLSANSDFIKDAIEFAIKNNVQTALVTQNIASKYKNKVDHFIELPFFEYNPNNLLLDSQVILHTFCLTFLNFLKS